MRPPLQTSRRQLFVAITLALASMLSLALGFGLARSIGVTRTEVDLSVVGDAVAAPPFYDLLFDLRSEANLHEALLPDPLTKVRPRPLYKATRLAGPHDAIGFRGESVPNRAEVVTIGDSQTYGWGVSLADNWPSQFATLSGRKVYNMALGGWGGVQYRYIAEKALAFGPQDIVVGLYLGNDSIESLTQAYSCPLYPESRVPGRDSLKAFTLKFEREDPLRLELPGGPVAFTPLRRWFANDRANEAVVAGYRILGDLCLALADKNRAAGANTTFLVIPTKESTYWPVVSKAGTDPGKVFRDLVEHESLNRKELSERLRAAGHTVIDTTEALQSQVLAGGTPYPLDADGHPNRDGYATIATAVANALAAAKRAPK